MRRVPAGWSVSVVLLSAALAACGSGRRDGGAQSPPADPTHMLEMSAQGQPGQAGEDGAQAGAQPPAAAGTSPGSNPTTMAREPTDAEPPVEETEPPSSDEEPNAGPRDPGPSRVLIFDGMAQQLVVYDAAGNVVHDLWPLLGIDGPTVTVSVAVGDRTIRADNTITSWRVRTDAPGLPDATHTRLLVARELPAGGMHVELWALDGQVLAEIELAERWQHFTLSPAEGYVLLERLQPDPSSFLLDAAVVRIADGEILWQGAHDTSAFARDDSHFVFVPELSDPVVGMLDLATGGVAMITPDPDLYEDPELGVSFGLYACSSQAAVLGTFGWFTDGLELWALDWDGQLRPLDPAFPRQSDQYFLEFRRDGASVMWQRAGHEPVNGERPIDPALLGYFEHDLATGENLPVASFAYECTAGREHRFEARDEGLAACDCAAPSSCEVIAPLPALTDRWVRSTASSADGRFVLVSHGWSANALPSMSGPDSLLFDAAGTKVSTLPNGHGEFDRESRLLLFETDWSMRQPGTYDRRFAIVDLDTVHVTWLDRPYWSAVVYE